MHCYVCEWIVNSFFLAGGGGALALDNWHGLMETLLLF
jgi:hypothetical protein